MQITPLMVKELREITGAGMLDCKKALEACDGDIEKSINYLREKGIAKAEKKALRVAAEGLCNIVMKDNVAIVYEINSETDFVAKNDRFLALINNIGEMILASDATNTEEALKVKIDNKELAQILLEATATIGEKLSLRRVTRIEKNSDQVFGAYKHMGGRIVSLVVLEGGSEEIAKDVAMHVAAMNPRYLSQNEISAEVVQEEKHILLQTALNENEALEKKKPVEIIEKMVEGRLYKYLQEICLLNQAFVKNPDMTIIQYVQQSRAKIISYLRLEVGEGIEKEVVDFAKEVHAQANLG